MLYHILLSHLDRDKEEIIIETGTNFGCTSIVLAQALKDSGCDGRVITIELEKSNVEIAKRNVHEAGLGSRIEFVLGDSKILLPEVVSKVGKIRFAFLDASHLYEDVMFEFETILPNLAEDGLVLFDNTYQIAEPGEDQRVYGALCDIKQRHGGELINLEFVSWYTPGLAIWQKRNQFVINSAS